MKINLNKKQLLEKLEFNYKIIDEKNNLGIDTSFSSIQIKINRNSLIFLSHCNVGIIRTSVDLGDQVGVEDSFIVNANNLFNVVKSFNDNDSIEIEILNDRIKFLQNKRLYELHYKKNLMFPKEDFGTEYEEVDKENFKKVVDKSIFCLGKEKMMPIMSCVWFGDGITLGGDGKRFSTIKCDLSIKDIAIPSEILLWVYDIIDKNKDSKLFYSRGSGNVYFKIDDSYYINGFLIPQEYPAKSMSQENLVFENSVSCKTEDFLNVVQNFSPMLNERFNRLKIVVGDKIKLIMETESCNGIDEIDIIDKNVKEEDVMLACNYRFLLDILREIKSYETFTLEFSDDRIKCNIKTSDDTFMHPICLISLERKN